MGRLYLKNNGNSSSVKTVIARMFKLICLLDDILVLNKLDIVDGRLGDIDDDEVIEVVDEV